MFGMNSLFRHKKKRIAKMYYAGILCAAGASTSEGSAITMQNEPIFINGDILKTRKGLRT